MELFTPLFCDFTHRPFPHFPLLGHAKSTRLAFQFPQTADPPALPRTADRDPPQNEVLEGPHKVIHHAPLSEQSGRKPSFRFKCVCRAKLWGAFQIATDTLARSSQVTIRSPSGGAFFLLQKIYIKASVRFRQRATVVLGWCPGPDDGSLAET